VSNKSIFEFQNVVVIGLGSVLFIFILPKLLILYIIVLELCLDLKLVVLFTF
jgi:hypothetical protein